MKIYEFECEVNGIGLDRAKTELRMSGETEKEAINNLNRAIEVKYRHEMLLWYGSEVMQEVGTVKTGRGITIRVKNVTVLEYEYTRIEFLDEL